jgi:hypothetical protein
MRYLSETHDVPVKIVKVIGDMCGILIYHRDRWLGAVRLLHLGGRGSRGWNSFAPVVGEQKSR